MVTKSIALFIFEIILKKSISRDYFDKTADAGLSVGVYLCGKAEDKAIKLNTDSICFGQTYPGICITKVAFLVTLLDNC